MDKSSILFVINKNAQCANLNKIKSLIGKINAYSNYEYFFADIDEFPESFYKFKYKIIVAVGGDGTVNKLLPYLVNANIKLGIIPCGTANLFASSLGIPSDIYKALSIIVKENSQKTDVGKIGEKYFMLRIGCGFDAEVIYDSGFKMKKIFGYFSYVLSGIKNALILNSHSYLLSLSNSDICFSAASVIVSNSGNMYGKYFNIAPEGKLNDGMLDVCILLSNDIKSFIDFLLKILFRQHKYCKNALFFRCNKLKIISNFAKVHIDGEQNTNSVLDINVLPASLNVIVP